MAVEKAVYHFRLTETVYLAKDVYIAAWSEVEASDCLEALMDAGDVYLNTNDIADGEGFDVESRGIADGETPDYDANEVLEDRE